MNIYFNFLSSTPLLIGQCPFYITHVIRWECQPRYLSTLWEEHDLWFGLNAFIFSSSGAVISLMGTHVTKHSQLEHASRFSRKDASLHLSWRRWAGAWGRHGESPKNADKSSAVTHRGGGARVWTAGPRHPGNSLPISPSWTYQLNEWQSESVSGLFRI